MFGENFEDILRKKYKFTRSEVTVTDCKFSDNNASGKTCYETGGSWMDQSNLLNSVGCDELIASYDALKKNQQCDVSTGKGMKEGGAGGAIYLLEKRGYLAMNVLVARSEFKNDASEHREKEQRAEIVAHECSLLVLDGIAITISSPTLYKLSLHNVTMKNVSGSGQSLSCSNSKVSTSDSTIYLVGVICQ